MNIVPPYGTRPPLEAAISHAKLFCFQKQYEIANQRLLFHRQGEDFVSQAIKDTIPYFLGAVDEQFFLKQHLLDTARDELRAIEVEIANNLAVRDALIPRVRGLVFEAKRSGLIDEGYEPTEIEEALERLVTVSRMGPGESAVFSASGDTLDRLRNEAHSLAERLANIKEDIRAARLFLSDQSGFLRESTEQRGRLSSLGLYKDVGKDGTTCPICSSALDNPTATLQELRSALALLESEITSVHRDNPHVQRRIDELESQKASVEDGLRENQRTFSTILAEDERARGQHDFAVARARTIGRIGAFMETARRGSQDDELESRLLLAQQRVQTLEIGLSLDEVNQRVDTYINLISRRMSEYSISLSLEHAGSALRLDLKNLTVVADTEDGPVPLTRMGSGENWVGYHVLAHLALHWWFRQRHRPVPRFLIFDQPSQAHYPPEIDDEGRLDPLGDEDRKAVRDLFRLVYEAATSIPDCQIIILDHAHIGEDWFENCIIEEWRHGAALVPPSWYAS
jgi:hypothetical protein